MLSAAEALNVRTIKIGPDVEAVDDAVPPLADLEHWAAELHHLAVQAAGVGTRVALEPLPFSNITDFRLAAELIAAADHPAAGLAVDIWHLERGPSSLADLAVIPHNKVFVVELNDAPEPQSADLFHDTVHHRVRCGSGTFRPQRLHRNTATDRLHRTKGRRDPLRGTPPATPRRGVGRRVPLHDGDARKPALARRRAPGHPRAGPPSCSSRRTGPGDAALRVRPDTHLTQ